MQCLFFGSLVQICRIQSSPIELGLVPRPHLAHARRRGLIELVNENKLTARSMVAYLPSVSSFLLEPSHQVYTTVWGCVRVVRILGEVIVLI